MKISMAHRILVEVSMGRGRHREGGGPIRRSRPKTSSTKMEDEGETLRAEGNALFQAKQYLKAAAVYTKAIKVDEKNAVLYSNRSAALLQLSKVKRALIDAQTCVDLRPEWEKGHFRKGAALEALEEWEGALEAYREAAACNPSNKEVVAKVKACSRMVKNRSKPVARDETVERRTANSRENGKKEVDLGKPIAFDVERIKNYAEELITESTTQFVEKGELEETVSFLPGRYGKGGGQVVGQVRIKDAFSSPDTLTNCVDFLRQYGEDVCAHAAVAVIDKSKIAYPQVWRKTGPSGWQLGDHKGFFVQLETPMERKIWFVRHKSGKAVPEQKVALDIDNFMLLPPLLRENQ